MRRARPALFRLAVALAFGLAALPASSALVIFEDGRHVHVKSFQVDDEDVTLTLEGGGSMTIPLDRVDRIVDDEFDHTPPVPALPAAKAIPSRSVRTSERPRSMRASPYDAIIFAASKEHGVDPALISAVIRAESNYAPRAVSRKGARGLMQLMPATARRLGVQRPFDPKENIRGGAAYLSELAARYGETAVDLILAAYNAGERAVEEHGGVPPYRETVAYVRRVTSFWSASHGDAPETETAAVAADAPSGGAAGAP